MLHAAWIPILRNRFRFPDPVPCLCRTLQILCHLPYMSIRWKAESGKLSSNTDLVGLKYLSAPNTNEDIVVDHLAISSQRCIAG